MPTSYDVHIPTLMEEDDATKAEGYTPPKAAQENARRVLRWREEHPDEIQGMTQVGWTRARQLASGEPVSLDIVRRMAQFNRHRQNATVDPKYKNEPWKDAGLVAWLGWGGSAGVDWAIRVSQAEVSKANYSKATCMLCKQNPPQYRVLWNEGKNESWMCKACFPGWFSENWQKVSYYDQIREEGIPKRYRIKRTVKETKVSKEDVLTIGDREVRVGELVEAWIEKQRSREDERESAEALDFEIVGVEKQGEKQLAYGLILRPNVTDLQGDIYTFEEVEKACHSYGAKAGGATDWQHRINLPREQVVLVESFIAPVDFVWNGYQVLKGDWLGCVWVKDTEKWQAVKSGEIKSFSIKGTGRRIPVGS